MKEWNITAMVIIVRKQQQISVCFGDWWHRVLYVTPTCLFEKMQNGQGSLTKELTFFTFLYLNLKIMPRGEKKEIAQRAEYQLIVLAE